MYLSQTEYYTTTAMTSASMGGISLLDMLKIEAE